MSSIVTSLLKVTIGLLTSKARDWAAEKFKDGDVVDKRIRDIITREIQDVKSKLDALSRKDLFAAMDAFETGVAYLYEAMGILSDAATWARQRIDEEHFQDTVNLSTSSTPVKSVVLAAGIKNKELTEFGGEANRALSQGKDRFKMAREEATKAFSNESLITLDRITAIRYRMMAAILESAAEILGATSKLSSLSVKSALKGALPECKQCLRKLHSLPDVKNNFKVELQKGLLNIRGRFKREDRREIISAVWQVNRAINDVLQVTRENIGICYYPTIDVEDEKIDPRSDERVAEVLQKLGIEHESSIGWSFGEDSEDDHKLKNAIGIATNADGEFIIGDNYETVKVFDNSGKFIYKFYPRVQTDDARAKLFAVATDESNNIYVLVLLDEIRSEVQVFNRAELLTTFPVRRVAELLSKLTVGNGKVLVSINERIRPVIDVYDVSGRYERGVGYGMLQDASDIAVGPGGQIFVLDRFQMVCIVFNKDGEKEHQFTVFGEKYEWPFSLAFHPLSEYIFIVGVQIYGSRLTVEMYTKDNVFYRKIILHEKEWHGSVSPSIAISKEGRLAVTCQNECVGAKVIVL